MIIDAHVHLYPTEVDRDPAAWAVAQGEAHWATLCTRTRKDGRRVQSLPTSDGLLRAMDAAGIGRAVLLGWYWEKQETCIWQNRFYAECVRKYPDRFCAFAALQPRAGFWPTLNEMHRARDDGLIGWGELSPHSQGYSVDDPVFHEVLVLAADWKMPVNLHVTDPESKPFPGRVDTPLTDFSRLARQFPRVSFVLAHWGGMLPLRDPSVLELKNVFFDTAASPLIYEADVWQRFCSVVPKDRVLFGSDFPLNLYPRVEVEAEMVRLVAEARAAKMGEDVLGENAVTLLQL
jgi:predicted TIM-barrel fold metal-dependent hydrolase